MPKRKTQAERIVDAAAKLRAIVDLKIEDPGEHAMLCAFLRRMFDPEETPGILEHAERERREREGTTA